MKNELVVMIGTRNRLWILKKCLQALIGKTECKTRIIVIDAGSTDGTIEYLKNLKGIDLVCDDKPIGQAQSYNRVLKRLECRYFCWLSEDNVIQPGALDSAVKILDTHHKIGMVALKTKDVAGPKVGQKAYLGGHYAHGILNVNQGVVRFNLFKKIGFFDEDLKNYGIDPDLTTKVLLAGYRVAYTKALAIHHYRDHDSDSLAIGKDEREKNKLLKVTDRINKRYSFLIECNFKMRIRNRIKSYIWNHIQKRSKKMRKKGIDKVLIAGRNNRDWYNLTHCRYISILDFFYYWNKPFYLVQRMSRSKVNLEFKPDE